MDTGITGRLQLLYNANALFINLQIEMQGKKIKNFFFRTGIYEYNIDLSIK